MPRVSVITPAYNAARFLPAAIDSVLSQTMTDWEMIVVDDGSTDTTSTVIADYEPRSGGRVRGIRQENKGVSAARNTAIRHARAPYLALLDADDVYLSDRLAACIEALDIDASPGLVHANTIIIDADGRRQGLMELGPGRPGGWIVRDIYTRRTHIQSPTATFRRSCLDEVGLFDESLRATEDRDLWVRIAERFEVRHIDRPLALYRRSANSVSTDFGHMMAGQIAFAEKNACLRGCGRLARRQALGLIHKERGDKHLLSGQPACARRHYLRGLAYDPTSIACAYMFLKSLLA